LTIGLLVWLREDTGTQLFFLYILQVAFHCLLVLVRPYEEALDNLKAYANESFISALLLLYMLASDLTYTRPVLQDLTPYGLLTVLFTSCAFNFLLFLTRLCFTIRQAFPRLIKRFSRY
jgi:hypothetical protein